MKRPTLEEIRKMSPAEYHQHRLKSLDEIIDGYDRLIEKYDALIISGWSAVVGLLGAPIVVVIIIWLGS